MRMVREKHKIFSTAYPFHGILIMFLFSFLATDVINDTLNFVDRRLFGADDAHSFEFGSYDAPSQPASKPVTQPKQRRRKKLNEDTVTPHIQSQKGGKRIGRPPKSSTDMGPPMGTPHVDNGLVRGPIDSKATNKANNRGNKNKKLNSGMPTTSSHDCVGFTNILMSTYRSYT